MKFSINNIIFIIIMVKCREKMFTFDASRIKLLVSEVLVMGSIDKTMKFNFPDESYDQDIKKTLQTIHEA